MTEEKKKKEPKPFIEFVGDYSKSAAATRSRKMIELKLLLMIKVTEQLLLM